MDQILFRDNSEIINLFESQSRTGKLGLFDLMNEECMLPQGNDIKLVNRMNSTWKDQNYGFSKDRLDPKNTFRIMHYANQVLYVVDNFVERNRDHVSLEILALMSESSNNLLSKLYVDQGSRSVDSENIQSTQNIKLDENGKPVNIISAVSKRNQKVTSFIKSQTAATKMRAQLDELMTQIFQTDISYIRCIKPNSTQLPTEFDRRMVLNQLNSSGVLDALRVTRAAYPYQISHADFLELVSDVIPVSAAKFNTLSTAGKCKKYLQYLPNFVNATSLTNKVGEDCFRQNRYEVGKSKVFFSNFYQTALEGLKHNLYSIQASKIQAAFRCKQRFIENLNKSAVKLQATYRMHRAQVAYKEQFKRELKASVSLQRGVRLFLYKKEIARKQDWAVGQLQAWARMLPIFRSYRRLIQVRDQEKCKRMLLHEARLKRRSTLDHVRRSLGNAHADCNTNCNCSIM